MQTRFYTTLVLSCLLTSCESRTANENERKYLETQFTYNVQTFVDSLGTKIPYFPYNGPSEYEFTYCYLDSTAKILYDEQIIAIVDFRKNEAFYFKNDSAASLMILPEKQSTESKAVVHNEEKTIMNRRCQKLSISCPKKDAILWIAKDFDFPKLSNSDYLDINTFFFHPKIKGVPFELLIRKQNSFQGLRADIYYSISLKKLNLNKVNYSTYDISSSIKIDTLYSMPNW